MFCINVHKAFIPDNSIMVANLNSNKPIFFNILDQKKLDNLYEIAEKQFNNHSKLFKKIVCRELQQSAYCDRSEWDDDWQFKKTCNCSEISELPLKYRSGQKFQIKLQNKEESTIDCVFHDRQSDTLIVVAPGFNNFYKQFCPTMWFFENSDILFFNFRGHFEPKTNDNPSFLQKQLHLCFNPKETTFGNFEEEEVIAVTNHCKNKKKYKKIIGLGFCFGAAMIVKAQSKNPNLFTHLILEGLWPDSKSIFQNVFSSKYFLSPKKSLNILGSFLTAGYQHYYSKQLIIFFKKKLLGNAYLSKEINICDYLSTIKIPSIFIHGCKDELINSNDFMKLITCSKSCSERIGIITTEKHLRSFLNCRFLYKIIAETIIEKDVTFLQTLLK